ncbi:hypothetical protein [Campylobacter fetus]|uniref:hypothetical protein n=1 Tax=Campylobacter fetus TaxID=196 RepID=UPI0002E69453|nr:hypothetical protein [Campylobacter fetus]
MLLNLLVSASLSIKINSKKHSILHNKLIVYTYNNLYQNRDIFQVLNISFANEYISIIYEINI